MENENQIPQAPAQSPSPEVKQARSIWKILSVILACVIVFYMLFLAWGFYLIKDEPDISSKQQQNTTMDNQKDNTLPKSYITMESESSDYRTFTNKVVAELAKGNTAYLNNNLSPSLVAANSQEALNSSFLPAAKKLFANFDHLGDSVTIQPSTDAYGNSGYSFAMTAVYKDNTEKDFKIYIVSEGGKLVVGNITD